MVAGFPVILFLSYAIIGAQEGAGGFTCLPLLATGIMLVSYLVRDARARRKLKPLAEASPLAWEKISAWLISSGFKARFFVSNEARSSYVRGVFHKDIVIQKQLVNKIESGFDKNEEAIILHEIGHLVASDPSKLSILSMLIYSIMGGLALTIPLIGLIVIINIGPGWLGYQALIPGWLEEQGQFILQMAILPLLLFFYLALVLSMRNIVRRSCEFLADAFVIQIQGSQAYLTKALIGASHFIYDGNPAPDGTVPFTSRPEVPRRSGLCKRILSRSWNSIFPGSHPGTKERLAAISKNPWIVLDMERVAMLTGMISSASLILFDFLPRGGEQTAILSLMVFIGYFGLSGYATVIALQAGGKLLRMLGVTARLLLFMLVGAGIGLVFYASILAVLLIIEHLTGGSVEAAGYIERLTGMIWVYPILFGLLLSNTLVHRELLTWYGNPYFLRRGRETWPVVSILVLPITLLAGIGLSTMGGWLVLPGFYGEVFQFPLLWMVVAWFSLACVYWALQVRRKCPKCGAHVRGYYQIGLACPRCETLLNPWLFDANAKTWQRQSVSEPILLEWFLISYTRISDGTKWLLNRFIRRKKEEIGSKPEIIYLLPALLVVTIGFCCICSSCLAILN